MPSIGKVNLTIVNRDFRHPDRPGEMLGKPSPELFVTSFDAVQPAATDVARAALPGGFQEMHIDPNNAIHAHAACPSQPTEGRHMHVRLSLDASELVAALSGLSAEIPQAAPEILDRALRASEFPLELIAFEVDASAAEAGVMTVRLQPSNLLRGLVAAARAGNVDRLIVEKSGHG
ncbi:MAG: hypothetical protein WA459_04020 [Stellaceae bacterium]